MELIADASQLVVEVRQMRFDAVQRALWHLSRMQQLVQVNSRTGCLPDATSPSYISPDF